MDLELSDDQFELRDNIRAVLEGACPLSFVRGVYEGPEDAACAALLDGAPRNAIVQCWLQLERDVAAAGLRRDPADTSLEFTERVLARYAVDSEAIDDLAARYREARFSDHQLDESARDAALAALDRLHQTLAATQTGTGIDVHVGAEA